MVLFGQLLSTLAPSSKPSHNYARQVGSDSLVGPNLVLGEKSTVKRSVLGKGVHVGTQTKISNCIIHDNVVLSDNVKLDSCIVASGARIESDVSLTKCEVGSGVEVFAGGECRLSIWTRYGLTRGLSQRMQKERSSLHWENKSNMHSIFLECLLLDRLVDDG